MNRVYHYKNGKWSLKQKCTSLSNAKSALRLLRSLESKEKREMAKNLSLKHYGKCVVCGKKTRKYEHIKRTICRDCDDKEMFRKRPKSK
jgi:hypothetical protein